MRARRVFALLLAFLGGALAGYGGLEVLRTAAGF
jgi:hypothetical protein